jgi:hypothetical protein
MFTKCRERYEAQLKRTMKELDQIREDYTRRGKVGAALYMCNRAFCFRQRAINQAQDFCLMERNALFWCMLPPEAV